MCSPKLASSWCFAFQCFQGCLPCGPTWATMRHNLRVPSSMHYEHEHVASCELLLQFITAFDSTIAAVASLPGPMSWVVTEVNAQCFYMSFAIEKEVASECRRGRCHDTCLSIVSIQYAVSLCVFAQRRRSVKIWHSFVRAAGFVAEAEAPLRFHRNQSHRVLIYVILLHVATHAKKIVLPCAVACASASV